MEKIAKKVVKLEERKYAVCIKYKDGKITHKYYGSHKKAYAYAERKWTENADKIETLNIDFTATIYEQWTQDNTESVKTPKKASK